MPSSTPTAEPRGARSVVGRVAWVVLAVSLVAVVGFQILNIVGSFEEFGLLDLQVYRMGAGALLGGRPLYDAVYPHDALPFTYTPFAAVLFVPLQLLGWTGSAVVMTLVSLGSLARVSVLLARRIVASGRSRLTFTKALLVVGWFGLAMWPSRSTFEYGQVNLVILWLVVEDLLGAGTRPRARGVLVGLATGIKLTPGLFIAFFVVTRQWRRVVGASVTTVATVALGGVVMRDQAWAYWTHYVSDPTRVGSPAFTSNQSLNGVIHRFAGPHPPPVLWPVAAAVTVAVSLAIATRLWNRGRVVEVVVAVSFGALLVSPISWTHHWVWLVVALAVLVVPATRTRPEPLGLQVPRIVLLIATVVVGTTRLMSVVDSGGDIEYTYGVGAQVVAAAFVSLAVAMLGYLFALSRIDDSPAEGPSTHR